MKDCRAESDSKLFDGFPERFFENVNCEKKKSADDIKACKVTQDAMKYCAGSYEP